MKLFLMVALVGFATALPLTFAQEAEPFVGGGLSVGLSSGDGALSVQGGLTELLGPLTLRGALDIGFGGGAGLGIDVLYPFAGEELTPYVGGGLGIGFGTASFSLGAIGGLEYLVADNIGLFAELQPGFVISTDSYYSDGFSAALRLGGNYYLD